MHYERISRHESKDVHVLTALLQFLLELGETLIVHFGPLLKCSNFVVV